MSENGKARLTAADVVAHATTARAGKLAGNPYLPEIATVVEIIEETPTIKTFRVRFDDPEVRESFSFAPGQVGQLGIFGVGESTFAISSKPSEKEFAAWLMYPKVFTDFAAAAETYGPLSTLPTPVYFYGLQPQDEIYVTLEKGKTMVIRCLAIGETAEDGMVTVFYELNGQPRRVKVPDRAHGATAGMVRRKAGDPASRSA